VADVIASITEQAMFCAGLADARANTVVLEAMHEPLRRQAPVPIGN
jgi:hypothetical protein